MALEIGQPIKRASLTTGQRQGRCWKKTTPVIGVFSAKKESHNERPGQQVSGWKTVLSRRQILGSHGTGAVGVASLAAGVGCATTPAPVNATPAAAAAGATSVPPVATQVQPPAAPTPKYGGTARMGISTDPDLDVHASSGIMNSDGGATVYSRLLKYKTGPDVKVPSYIAVPDAAESFDQVNETTYVFKLRPNLKFHNIAPVNGRQAVAQDVVYSFTRQIAEKANAGLLSAIDKMEAVDPLTVKLTLTGPDADFLSTIAAVANKIVPKERVDSAGDLKGLPAIGTGPYILEQFDPATANQSLTRNPDYFIKGVPYF